MFNLQLYLFSLHSLDTLMLSESKVELLYIRKNSFPNQKALCCGLHLKSLSDGAHVINFSLSMLANKTADFPADIAVN